MLKIKYFWAIFSENKGAVLGLFFLLGLSLCATFASLIAWHDPYRVNIEHRLMLPQLKGQEQKMHIFEQGLFVTFSKEIYQDQEIEIISLESHPDAKIVLNIAREEYAASVSFGEQSRLQENFTGRMQFAEKGGHLVLKEKDKQQVIRFDTSQEIHISSLLDPSSGFQVRVKWQEARPVYFLGTDEIGRDMLARLLYGARNSLFSGFLAVLIASCIGISLGLISGYFQGWFDDVFMRFIDILLTLPSLLLAIVFVSVLGESSLENALFAVVIVLIPHFVRIVRASVLLEKNKDYVHASRMLGASHFRLIFYVIFPNCIPPLIVQGTLSFSSAILDIAALGFLGIGAQAPEAEWGNMLAKSREFIQSDPLIVVFPGLAIFLTLLSLNLVGDGLRDVLDPRMKK